MSMNNKESKYDHLWDTEDSQENVRPCTTMCENMIIYETQKILRKAFKKNVPPCTIIYENTII